MSKKFAISSIIMAAILCGCGPDWPSMEFPTFPDNNFPEGGDNGGNDDGTSPDPGEIPDTGDADDPDEMGSGGVVSVIFDGGTASVSDPEKRAKVTINGAYVTLEMADVTDLGIKVSGKTEDGALKIYASNPTSLSLDGVSITSRKGAALNYQCSKRLYIYLQDGTENIISDAAEHIDVPENEDSKGCLFSEGQILVSGSGTLNVSGNAKHAIAVDDYILIMDNAHITVKNAVVDAIHSNRYVKIEGGSLSLSCNGDGIDTEGDGIFITGGSVTINSVGKGLSTSGNMIMDGGEIHITATGDAVVDGTDIKASSAVKCDMCLTVNDGILEAIAKGKGAKGISVDGDIFINGGAVTAKAEGANYGSSSSSGGGGGFPGGPGGWPGNSSGSSSDTSKSAKGIKADGNITITGGVVDASSASHEGIESKKTLSITGGEITSIAKDDAINATTINISGGWTYAYAESNDGIDCNGVITISGGTVIGNGASDPEGGIDCDRASNYKVTGGIVITTGGQCQNAYYPASGQGYVAFTGISVTKGQIARVVDSSEKNVVVYTFPRSMSGCYFVISAPGLSGNYSLYTGASASGTPWNGWYEDAVATGGTKSKTVSSK